MKNVVSLAIGWLTTSARTKKRVYIEAKKFQVTIKANDRDLSLLSKVMPGLSSIIFLKKSAVSKNNQSQRYVSLKLFTYFFLVFVAGTVLRERRIIVPSPKLVEKIGLKELQNKFKNGRSNFNKLQSNTVISLTKIGKYYQNYSKQ